MLPISEEIKKDLLRVWEKSFNGLGREREEKAFREFSPSVLVWSKPLQGSRVSKKPSRNILGGVCGSSMILFINLERRSLREF